MEWLHSETSTKTRTNKKIDGLHIQVMLKTHNQMKLQHESNMQHYCMQKSNAQQDCLQGASVQVWSTTMQFL